MSAASGDPIDLVMPPYSARILPRLGGSLGWLRWHGKDLTQSFPESGETTGDPARTGMFPMVPFAGRIANARFFWHGEEHCVPAHSSEPNGLHGDGWTSTWDVIARDESSAILSLRSECGALAYHAEQEFRLTDAGLEVVLQLRNLASCPLPFGLGFHPWFPRRTGAQLRFAARRFWLEAPGGYPSDPIGIPPELDFSDAREVPTRWRNNVYEGWDGVLRIAWPGEGMAASLTASKTLDWLMIYANPALDCICLEPQSHLPAAHNRADHGNLHGLVELRPGEQISGSITIGASTL